jgi:FixJ family two-component response regulator
MTQTNVHLRPITVADHELAARCARGRVVIIDDDGEIISALAALIHFMGYACETYTSALDYLHVLNCNRPYFPGPCCVLCDVKMPEFDGLELQSRLAEFNNTPMLLMSGCSAVKEVISAFHAGALDFLIKPIDADGLMLAVRKALDISLERQAEQVRTSSLSARLATLTAKERDIARRVAAGKTNPFIAETFGIALRTVKLHRQRAMQKIGANNIADLVRIADEIDL